MSDRFSFDVFLSHSTKDKKVVRDIANKLQRDGVRVWLAEWEIRPGDNILAKIEEGLEDARVLVLCMSAHAFGSDWTQLEAGTFRFRDPQNKERRFIPLRLDETPIKGSLAQLLYINWLPAYRDQEYPNLLEACRTPAKPMLILEGHSDSITALKWLNRANGLISASYDGTVRFWDVFRHTEQAPTQRVLWRSKDRVLALAIRADDTAAVFSRNGDITVLNSSKWDLRKGAFRRVSRSPTIFSASWLSDRTLITAEDDGIARITDEAGIVHREYLGHKSLVRTLTLFQERNFLVTGSHDRSIRTWNIATGKEISCHQHAHANDINAVCRIGPTAFASSGDDGLIHLWHLTSVGKCIATGTLRGHKSYVIELSVSRDFKILASKSSHRVCLWSLDTKSLIREIYEPMDVSWPVGLAFHPRENILATLGHEGRTIRIWKYLENREFLFR